MQLRKPIVSERTLIKAEFIKCALSIVDDKWSVLQDSLEVRGRLSPDDKKLAQALRPLHKRDREAIERLKADLMGMPYCEVGAIQHNGQLYLYGLTRPITAVAYNVVYSQNNKSESRGSEVAKYDIGRYHVIMKQSDLLRSHWLSSHLVPEREPSARSRHYHHRAYPAIGSDEITHPLDAEPSWCTASFSSIFASLIGMLDFPGIFKIMHKFLSIYNTNSPLVSRLPFERRMS